MNKKLLADKHPTSTRQAPDKLHTDNANVKQLVSTINGRQLSVKEMLSEMGLKDRERDWHCQMN